MSSDSGAVGSTAGLVLLAASFRLGRPVEAQALARPIHRYARELLRAQKVYNFILIVCRLTK